ncbi:MAG: hypothetical protein R2747_17570 [Pyrinomonadaceae bacterium]
MNRTGYEQIIMVGIRNLSPERQREENSAEYDRLIEADLAKLETDELTHLEEELEDCEQLHPRR